MNNSGLVFADNRFVPLKKAAVPITDLAVQRGTGLFETLRTYNKIPLALEERLRRLRKSAKFLDLKFGFAQNFIRKKIFEGIKKFQASEVLIKIIVTGGDSHALIPEGSARLYILFLPFVPWPRRFYQKGIKIATTRLSRMLTEIKSLSYLPAVVAYEQALNRGFDEAVFVNEKNNILEGTTFNFALIKNKKLITPKTGMLEGVTMDIVLKVAPFCALNTVRRAISYAELKKADEAFITSATREVIPVVKVDQTRIGSGRPGPYTKQLLTSYRNYARSFDSPVARSGSKNKYSP